MTLPLPPLDMHAHVETTISARELAALDAVTFAVTRSPREWETAVERRDTSTAWGIGCHPGVATAVRAFSADEFTRWLAAAAFVGEVGLDGRSKVALADQRCVLDQILLALQSTPRPVSIHSVAASGEVISALRARPVIGAILHWWRGTAEETSAAIDMGCFFSLNGAEARRPKVLSLLPRDRVLTETDFPHTRRADRAAERPGRTETIERALEAEWHEDRWGVRQQLWRNLRTLVCATDSTARMPRVVKAGLLTVGAWSSGG
ncbi:MAG: TatD family hydrolase [Solirubrobacteraceae bacterium]